MNNLLLHPGYAATFRALETHLSVCASTYVSRDVFIQPGAPYTAGATGQRGRGDAVSVLLDATCLLHYLRSFSDARVVSSAKAMPDKAIPVTRADIKITALGQTYSPLGDPRNRAWALFSGDPGQRGFPTLTKRGEIAWAVEPAEETPYQIAASLLDSLMAGLSLADELFLDIRDDLSANSVKDIKPLLTGAGHAALATGCETLLIRAHRLCQNIVATHLVHGGGLTLLDQFTTSAQISQECRARIHDAASPTPAFISGSFFAVPVGAPAAFSILPGHGMPSLEPYAQTPQRVGAAIDAILASVQLFERWHRELSALQAGARSIGAPLASDSSAAAQGDRVATELLAASQKFATEPTRELVVAPTVRGLPIIRPATCAAVERVLPVMSPFRNKVTKQVLASAALRQRASEWAIQSFPQLLPSLVHDLEPCERPQDVMFKVGVVYHPHSPLPPWLDSLSRYVAVAAPGGVVNGHHEALSAVDPSAGLASAWRAERLPRLPLSLEAAAASFAGFAYVSVDIPEWDAASSAQIGEAFEYIASHPSFAAQPWILSGQVLAQLAGANAVTFLNEVLPPAARLGFGPLLVSPLRACPSGPSQRFADMVLTRKLAWMRLFDSQLSLGCQLALAAREDAPLALSTTANNVGWPATAATRHPHDVDQISAWEDDVGGRGALFIAASERLAEATRSQFSLNYSVRYAGTLFL